MLAMQRYVAHFSMNLHSIQGGNTTLQNIMDRGLFYEEFKPILKQMVEDPQMAFTTNDEERMIHEPRRYSTSLFTIWSREEGIPYGLLQPQLGLSPDLGPELVIEFMPENESAGNYSFYRGLSDEEASANLCRKYPETTLDRLNPIRYVHPTHVELQLL
jgi:hypothetical protein